MPCDDAVTLRRLLPGDILRLLPGGVPLPADRRPSSMLRLLTLPVPASASTAAGKEEDEAQGSEYQARCVAEDSVGYAIKCSTSHHSAN